MFVYLHVFMCPAASIGVVDVRSPFDNPAAASEQQAQVDEAAGGDEPAGAVDGEVDVEDEAAGDEPDGAEDVTTSDGGAAPTNGAVFGVGGGDPEEDDTPIANDQI